MFLACAAFACAVSSGGCSGPAAEAISPPAAFHGTWKGAAVQDSLNSDAWTMELLISDTACRFSRPSIKCSGTMSVMLHDGDRLLFKEKLDGNWTGCVDRGLSEITLRGDSVALYRLYFENGRAAAVGTLFRAER